MIVLIEPLSLLTPTAPDWNQPFLARESAGLKVLFMTREHRLDSFLSVSSWEKVCIPRQDLFQFRRLRDLLKATTTATPDTTSRKK